MSEVQKRPNKESKRLLEAEASNLASYYSRLAEEKAVNPKLREATLVYALAEEHLLDQELEDALQKATQALELFREAQSKPGQQDAVRLLCSAERQKHAPDFSIDKLQAELRSFRDNEDKRGQGCMLLGLAEAQLAKALAGEAISNIEEALPLLRAAGDKRLEAFGNILAAQAQLRRCQAKDAVLSAESAVALYKEAGDRTGEGKSYNWLSLAQMDLLRATDALTSAHAALEIATELESPRLQVQAMQLLVKVHVFKEKTRPAVQYAERSLAVCRKCESKQEGVALRLLVKSLIQRGDLKRALKEAEGALEDYDASGNKSAEAAAHGALADVRRERNEMELAISEQNQELDLLKELGDRPGQMDSLLALSSLHSSKKAAGSAKERAEEAKQLADDLQDKKAEVLATIALVEAQLVDSKSHEDAANAAQEAHRAAQETEDRRLEANALTAISKVSSAKGEHASAISKLFEAKTLLLEAGDKRSAASTMLISADAQLLNQQADDAIQSAEDAKNLCKEIDFKKGMADALRKLAAAHLAKGDEQEAIKQALIAKKYCKAIEDVRGETALLHFLASSSLQRGDKKGQEVQQFQAKKQQDSGAGIEASRRHRNSAHEAVKRAQEAMVIAKRNEDPYAEASAMAHLAHAMAILNRGQEALGTCRRAEDLFREAGAVSEQASTVCLSAEVANLMGNKPKALDLANRALELARRAEDGQVEGRILGVMEHIKGVQKQVQQEIPDQMFADPGAAAAAGAASAGPAVPKGLDPMMVQQKLMTVVEQVSGGGEDEVHLDTPLMESGLDSLSAVAFRNELSRQFEGIGTLPAALMFDYPSARSIAEHLVDRSKGLA